MSFIELENLSFRHQKSDQFTFENLNLRLEAGSTTAIMGPSGSGKSTLLSILGALRRPTSGAYRCNGYDISAYSDQQRTSFRGEKVGFVFQDFKLMAHLNVIENIFLPVEHLKGNGENWHSRADSLLKLVGLSEYSQHMPTQLSGGQAQRVAIARALMRNPKLLLADEPTGSLDDQSAYQILEMLKNFAVHGMTVVMVTHNQDAASELEQTFVLQNRTLFKI